MKLKLFTLEEARSLLPALRESIDAANKDLDHLEIALLAASQNYDLAETKLSESDVADAMSLRAARDAFQKAIQGISQAQSDYGNKLMYWASEIGKTGVVVRDIRQGLIDFAASKDETEYFLCWQTPEPDIQFWHLDSDGFAGRKPLVTLAEYY